MLRRIDPSERLKLIYEFPAATFICKKPSLRAISNACFPRVTFLMMAAALIEKTCVTNGDYAATSTFTL
jgi:hypothetical protein